MIQVLLLLSRSSHVRLCVTPEKAAHQTPLSLGFSRQEHWSGLPFPSPIRESEVAQSCPTLSDPMDCSLPGSSVHGIFQARVLEWGAIAFSLNLRTEFSQLINLNLATNRNEYTYNVYWASLVAQMVKEFSNNAGDLGSVPGSGRSPGEGNNNPL